MSHCSEPPRRGCIDRPPTHGAATTGCRCSSDKPISLCPTAVRHPHRVTSAHTGRDLAPRSRPRASRGDPPVVRKNATRPKGEFTDLLSARACVGRASAGIQADAIGGSKVVSRAHRCVPFRGVRGRAGRPRRCATARLRIAGNPARPSRVLLADGARSTRRFCAPRSRFLGDSDK